MKLTEVDPNLEDVFGRDTTVVSVMVRSIHPVEHGISFYGTNLKMSDYHFGQFLRCVNIPTTNLKRWRKKGGGVFAAMLHEELKSRKDRYATFIVEGDEVLGVLGWKRARLLKEFQRLLKRTVEYFGSADVVEVRTSPGLMLMVALTNIGEITPVVGAGLDNGKCHVAAGAYLEEVNGFVVSTPEIARRKLTLSGIELEEIFGHAEDVAWEASARLAVLKDMDVRDPVSCLLDFGARRGDIRKIIAEMRPEEAGNLFALVRGTAWLAARSSDPADRSVPWRAFKRSCPNFCFM